MCSPVQHLTATFDRKLFESTLHTVLVGRNLKHFAEVDSTMSCAEREIASGGAPSGTLILADTQTRGRGRVERVWFSTPTTTTGGGNLYFTVIFRCATVDHLFKLNICTPIAVTMACRELGAEQAGIKWPNDVWIDYRKVCGILIDTHTSYEQGKTAFIASVGVGINVNEDMAQNKHVAHIATSLASVLHRPVQRECLLASICNSLEQLYTSDSTVQQLVHLYAKYDLLNGREVVVMPKKLEGGEERPAKVVGFGHTGSLQVVYLDDSTGVCHELVSEEVTIRVKKKQ